jgi:hypothetical protein
LGLKTSRGPEGLDPVPELSTIAENERDSQPSQRHDSSGSKAWYAIERLE